jgi:hypothetical protein
MMDHVILDGGPAAGRKLVVKAGLEEINVAARERDEADRPRRRRHAGKRDCRYRRTDRGVGTGLIPRRYRFVA